MVTITTIMVRKWKRWQGQWPGQCFRVMVIVAIPLVVRVGKASVAEVTKYVAGTVVLTALMCVYSFGINYCLWFQ